MRACELWDVDLRLDAVAFVLSRALDSVDSAAEDCSEFSGAAAAGGPLGPNAGDAGSGCCAAAICFQISVGFVIDFASAGFGDWVCSAGDAFWFATAITGDVLDVG